MSKVGQFFKHPVFFISVAAVTGVVALQVANANPFISRAGSPAPTVEARLASFEEAPSEIPRTRSLALLRAMDEQFSTLVKRVSPSVVHIRSTRLSSRGAEVPLGQGSGVIIRPDGWIVTNDHVVNGAKDVTVILSNGKEYKGRVTESTDDRNDIAVIKIDARDLPAARFGNSDSVRPGQFAVAVGAPFGLENTVTIGHISAKGRANAAGGMNELRVYSDMIQTDAPINPGNSGGPLLNIEGEIVGINTAILSGGGAFGTPSNAGIGFAIPSNQAKLIADMLIGQGKLTRGYLGILLENLKPYEIEEKRLPGGVRIAQLPPTGAAARAGLRQGDIITKVGSFSVIRDQDVLNAMLNYRPGTKVDVTVLREGKALSRSVTVASAPPRLQADASPQMEDEPGLRDFNPFERLDPREWFGERENRSQDDSSAGESQGPARLGVNFLDLDEANREQYNVPPTTTGVVVESVEAGSVADRAGLKPGDVITRLGDQSIVSGSDLIRAVRGYRRGERTQIAYERFSEGTQARFDRSIRF